MGKKKKEPSKFMELISMALPSFYDFNYDVEEFCGYYQETGKTCPLIEADKDTGRLHSHIPNWDAQNCMWLCKWFIKQDLPAQSKRVIKRIPT